MQTAAQGKIKTIIVAKDPELCSHFAAHEQISVIGHFESASSLNSSFVLKESDLLIIEANTLNDPGIQICVDATSESSVELIVLNNAYASGRPSPEGCITKPDHEFNGRVFEKPWNFVEILNHIRYRCKHDAAEPRECKVQPIPQCDRDSPREERTSILSFRQETTDEEIINLQQGSKESTKVITIANSKGGVGKTFLAVNLACELANKNGCRVALIDGNLGSGDMALHLDMLNAPTITDLLANLHEISGGNVSKFLPKYEKGSMHVLLGPGTPELCEFVESKHIMQLIGLMKNSFNRIIIDTASSSFNMITFDLLEISDIILMVTTCDLSSLQQTRTMIHLLRRLSIDVDSKVQIIVNRLTPDSAVSPARIEEFLQMKIKGVIPEEGSLVNQSILHGSPVVLNNRMDPFRQDLKKVFETLQMVERPFNSYTEASLRKTMFDSLRSILFERKGRYGRRA